MKENLFTPSKLVKNKMIDTLKLDNVMKKTLDWSVKMLGSF